MTKKAEITMSVYVIAQLQITDRVAYGRYQQQFMGVLNRFQGRVLAADEKPLVVEGGWEGDKVVLLSFPDETTYQEWAGSPDYQKIAEDRKAGSSAVVLLVKGVR
jgi:uncharacterized protein (DUF1330 family)